MGLPARRVLSIDLAGDAVVWVHRWWGWERLLVGVCWVAAKITWLGMAVATGGACSWLVPACTVCGLGVRSRVVCSWWWRRRDGGGLAKGVRLWGGDRGSG